MQLDLFSEPAPPPVGERGAWIAGKFFSSSFLQMAWSLNVRVWVGSKLKIVV